MSEASLCTAIGKELIIMTLLLLLVSANVLNYLHACISKFSQQPVGVDIIIPIFQMKKLKFRLD